MITISPLSQTDNLNNTLTATVSNNSIFARHNMNATLFCVCFCLIRCTVTASIHDADVPVDEADNQSLKSNEQNREDDVTQRVLEQLEEISKRLENVESQNSALLKKHDDNFDSIDNLSSQLDVINSKLEMLDNRACSVNNVRAELSDQAIRETGSGLDLEALLAFAENLTSAVMARTTIVLAKLDEIQTKLGSLHYTSRGTANMVNIIVGGVHQNRALLKIIKHWNTNDFTRIKELIRDNKLQLSSSNKFISYIAGYIVGNGAQVSYTTGNHGRHASGTDYFK